MSLAELSGLSLHYEEHGDGSPLLLIAGIPAIANDWEPLSMRRRMKIVSDCLGSDD